MPKASAVINLTAGVWAAFATWEFGSASLCPSGGCPVPLLQEGVPVIGVLLALDALACYVGFRTAFAAGLVLSAVIAGATLFDWAGSSGGEVWAALVVISLVSVIFNILALRPRGQLKEQANPMNLPVFG